MPFRPHPIRTPTARRSKPCRGAESFIRRHRRWNRPGGRRCRRQGAGGAGSQRPRGGLQQPAHQRPLRPGRHPAQLRGGRAAPWASVASVLVVPLLAEPVAYLGVVLPRLEQRLGRPWLAALIVVALWAAEHALYPLLTSSGGGLDLGFAAYRWGRCCRTWPPDRLVLRPGCCRSWWPGGCSTAAPPSPWPSAWSDEPGW
jgi:hypothetical protein